MRLLFFLIFLTANLQAQSVLTSDSTLNEILLDIEGFQNNRYSEEEREVYPLGFATEEFYDEEYHFNLSILERLDAINTESLSFDDYISHSLLRFDVENDIKLFEYKEYLIPILSESGFHTRVLWRTNRALQTEDAVTNYIKFLEDIPRYFDENIALMREGMELGIAQPLEGLQNYQATYEPYIVENPSISIFFGPMVQFSATYTGNNRSELIDAVKGAITNSVTPAYQNLKDFFEEEYFPNTREGLGAATMPDGQAYYEHKTRYYTTQDILPQNVHEIGLEEVARIQSEMETIIEKLDFEGSLVDFIHFLRTNEYSYPKSADELLKEAAWIAKKLTADFPPFLVGYLDSLMEWFRFRIIWQKIILPADILVLL